MCDFLASLPFISTLFEDVVTCSLPWVILIPILLEHSLPYPNRRAERLFIYKDIGGDLGLVRLLAQLLEPFNPNLIDRLRFFSLCSYQLQLHLL